MKDNIKLGDKVRDEITGMEGIVVARTKFLNGCIQYSVAQKLEKPNSSLPVEGEPSIDNFNLKVIKKNAVNSAEYKEKTKKEQDEEDETIGGRTKFGYSKMRGY